MKVKILLFLGLALLILLLAPGVALAEQNYTNYEAITSYDGVTVTVRSNFGSKDVIASDEHLLPGQEMNYTAAENDGLFYHFWLMEGENVNFTLWLNNATSIIGYARKDYVDLTTSRITVCFDGRTYTCLEGKPLIIFEPASLVELAYAYNPNDTYLVIGNHLYALDAPDFSKVVYSVQFLSENPVRYDLYEFQIYYYQEGIGYVGPSGMDILSQITGYLGGLYDVAGLAVVLILDLVGILKFVFVDNLWLTVAVVICGIIYLSYKDADGDAWEIVSNMAKYTVQVFDFLYMVANGSVKVFYFVMSALRTLWPL